MSLTETEFAQLQLLLDQVGAIDYQYKKKNKEDRFNIFNILAKRFDEVNLHSRFIYELLNPLGSHGCEAVFLTQLFSHLKILNFDLEHARVRKEYRKIDLLITNEHHAVVIENKLWAPDQPAQLQRYFDVLTNEGYKTIRIYYLSIDGKDPEEHSIGNLRLRPDWDTIFSTISYEVDIEKWLENCIKEVYSKPILRETLIQYRLLIREISGKTMHREEMDEIIDFIAQGDNVVKAKKIAENWKHVRWFTEWYFWLDLEKAISTKYVVLDIQKYSADNLNSVIHSRRNQNPYYGIMFQIGSYLDADACIFIERGGNGENVYYGLTMLKGQSKDQSGDIRFKPIAEEIANFSEWYQETHWIGGNYCKPEINFNEFSNADTLKLLNDDFRSQYIYQLWSQIQNFVDKVMSLNLIQIHK